MSDGSMGKRGSIEATASDSPVMQGRNAREYGRGVESCPYPEGSPEREGWMEGFGNVTAEDFPDAGRPGTRPMT